MIFKVTICDSVYFFFVPKTFAFGAQTTISMKFRTETYCEHMVSNKAISNMTGDRYFRIAAFLFESNVFTRYNVFINCIIFYSYYLGPRLLLLCQRPLYFERKL